MMDKPQNSQTSGVFRNADQKEILVQQWMQQAMAAGDLPRAREMLALFSTEGERQRYAQEIETLERSIRANLGAENAGYQKLSEQAEAVMKGLRGTPQYSLESIRQLAGRLQGAEEKARKRLDVLNRLGWQKEALALKTIYARLENNTRAIGEKAKMYQQVRASRVSVVEQLWPLVMPGSAYDQNGEVKSTPAVAGVSASQRRMFGGQILGALDDLLRIFPGDADAEQWKNWRARLVSHIPDLKAGETGMGKGIRAWVVIVAAIVFLAIGLVGGFLGRDLLGGGATVTQEAVITPTTAQVAEVVPTDTPQPEATAEPTAMVDLPTTTPEPTAEPTATPEPLPVAMIFPREGSNAFPIFPWQIVFDVTEALAEDPILWLQPVNADVLKDKPITLGMSTEETPQPVTGVLTFPVQLPFRMDKAEDGLRYTFTRSYADLVDLPDGEYEVLVSLTSSPEGRTSLGKVVIDGKLLDSLLVAVKTLYNFDLFQVPANYNQRLNKTIPSIAQDGNSLVTVFGKVRFVDDLLNPQEKPLEGVYQNTLCFVQVSREGQQDIWGWAACWRVMNPNGAGGTFDLPLLGPDLPLNP